MKIIDKPYPHCTWPYIDDKFKADILKQLERPLSEVDNSGQIGKYEKALRLFYNMQYALTFSSATGAMHSAIHALGIHHGDMILAPNYTFFATMSPFSFEGIEVKLVDCDQYGNICINDIKNAYTNNVKAIVITHMWGIPCDLDEIVDYCQQKGIYLIEDCSHCHFGSYKGKRVGTFGNVSIFSTNQKAITSGEGGFLLTNSKEIFDKSLLVAHYNKRCKKELSPNSQYMKFSLTGFGLKYRLSPIAATIGLNQILNSGGIERRRRANLSKFKKAIEDSVFENIHPNYEFEHGLYVFTFLCNNAEKVLNQLHKLGGIEFDIPGSTRPLSKEPLFNQYILKRGDTSSKHILNNQSSFPSSEQFSRSMIKCPLWGYPDDSYFVDKYIEMIKIVSSTLTN